MNSSCADKNKQCDHDNKANRVFYFSNEHRLPACKSLLNHGYYAYHISRLPPVLASCDPPVLETHQVQNCKMTPAEDVFSDAELLEIIHKAEEVQKKPITAGSIPSFVTLHKVFLFPCVLCLFHAEGVCATIANQQSTAR